MSSHPEVSAVRPSASTPAGRDFAAASDRSAPLRALLERGQVFFEKCELGLAKAAFLEVVERVQQMESLDTVETAVGTDPKSARAAGADVPPREALIEAIAVLLRLAAEADDDAGVAHWDAELERHLPFASGRTLALAWHKRGVVASHRDQYRKAQSHYFRALRIFESTQDLSRIYEPQAREDLKLYANIQYSLAVTLMNRGLYRRSELLTDALFERFEGHGVDLGGIHTQLCILKSILAEHKNDLEQAREWCKQAHTSVLAERNWYFHFYVLLAYARIERLSRNFAQAYWYLDLISRATTGPEYANLRRVVETERRLLETDAVDLLIDSRQCEIRTREKKDLSLGKQYVLLGILEALTEAHYRDAPDSERGLSKSEIIERVWREKYRPEAHDNKLYYNINRLRKLIEPDMRHPRYLLNWKEGYRLAPGLKVHFIGGRASTQLRGNA
jgi:DNA-binding winged helix-turn-helix (wHTH) protein